MRFGPKPTTERLLMDYRLPSTYQVITVSLYMTMWQITDKSTRRLTTFSIAALFVFVVFAWGLNWVVMKLVVRELTPLWAVAIRTLIALAVLIPAVLLTG